VPCPQLSDCLSGPCPCVRGAQLIADKDAKTLTLIDRGCGMSKEDLINHLGVWPMQFEGHARFRATQEAGGTGCRLVAEGGLCEDGLRWPRWWVGLSERVCVEGQVLRPPKGRGARPFCCVSPRPVLAPLPPGCVAGRARRLPPGLSAHGRAIGKPCLTRTLRGHTPRCHLPTHLSTKFFAAAHIFGMLTWLSFSEPPPPARIIIHN
jgi:hypothetical protein